MGLSMNQFAAAKLYPLIFLICCAIAVQDVNAQPEKDYPVYVINLIEGGGQAKPLVLKGAKNEHLLVIFGIDGAQVANLSIEMKRKNLASPKLPFQTYQLRPVPVGLPREFHSDGLVPLEPGLLYPESSARIAVSVKIPEGTLPSRHLYDLVFRSGPRWLTQPLEVEVWNFSLPNDLPIAIHAQFRAYADWFKRYGVQTHQCMDMVSEAYLRSFREYKVNSLQVSSTDILPVNEVVDGRAVANFTRYTHMLDFVTNLGYRYFVLPYLPGARSIGKPNNRFIEEAGRYYPAMYQYLQSRNLVNQALVKVLDEPKADDPIVLQAYGAVKRAVPEFRTLCTGAAPNPELAQVINIWATYRAVYNAKKIAAARSRGQEMWLYANALVGADRPSLDQRLIGWNLFFYNYTGYYLYGVNFWTVDPWQVPPSRKDFYRRGVLYYPHPRTGMPLPTLRWEAFRRGLQDYQYLVQLREAHRQGRIPPQRYVEIERRIDRYGRFAGRTQVNWADLEEVREQIGALLSR
jgi:hypothetical protein